MNVTDWDRQAVADGRLNESSETAFIGPQSPKVLMFAYYFPPYGGGGVQRTLKYVKYLPAAGFRSIVITGSAQGPPISDHTLLREVPSGTVVIRARAIPVQKARWKLEGLLRRVGLPPQLAGWVGWPDEMVGWLPAAVWHGVRAARKHRPTVLYSTSSPMTAHLAALAVHQRTGIPWVADFRDSWAFNPYRSVAGSRLAQAQYALERHITSEVTTAVVVDESIRLVGLPEGDSKIVIIRNGIDPEDIRVGDRIRPDADTFRLAYVGSLYASRDAGAVLAAVRALIAGGRLDPSRFELRIVGTISTDRSALESVPITEVAYVDHQRAIQEMAHASALLHYSPRGELGSSGKIYEYLAVGRPVLCVADPLSRAYRLVAGLGGGECVAPEVDAVADALELLVRRWQVGALNVDPAVRHETLRRFSRRSLAFELARVLEAAISCNAHSTPAAYGSDRPAPPDNGSPHRSFERADPSL